MIRFLTLPLLALSMQVAHGNTDLQQCYETCQTFAEPGYDIKKCMAECVAEYSEEVSIFSLLNLSQDPGDVGCETYEDACNDVIGDSGPNDPDYDGEPVRGGEDEYEGVDGPF